MRSKGVFIKSGKGGMARVELKIDLEASTPGVTVELNENVWNAEIKKGAFPDWIEGAVYGAEFALRLAEISSASVRIVVIAGLLTDSTATNVAAAAANAVWNAVNFEVPQEVTDRINQAVLVEWNDWNQPVQSFDVP